MAKTYEEWEKEAVHTARLVFERLGPLPHPKDFHWMDEPIPSDLVLPMDLVISKNSKRKGG